MRQQRNDHGYLREKALADGVAEVASELRLVDVVDLVGFIRTEQFGNVGDLVSSAAEQFFKPDTLRYGRASEVELHWGGAPSIVLDMEFHNRGISVYFSLRLEELKAGVEINYINFGAANRDPCINTAALVAAINDARLTPVPAVPQPRADHFAASP